MEVEYTLTVGDHQAFERHHLAHRQAPAARRSVPWVFIFVALLFGAMLVTRFIKSPKPAEVGGTLVMGGVLGFCGALLLFVKLGKVATTSAQQRLEDPRNQQWRGPWKLALSPDGITHTSDLTQLFERWAIVGWIDATKDYVFLYTSPYSGHAVPRRAFRDDRHFDEFVDLARRYRDEAKATSQSQVPIASSDAITRDIG